MRIGTGSLKWTQQQTDDTDMTVIEQAYSHHLEELHWVTGRTKQPPQPKLTPSSLGTRKMKLNTGHIMTLFGKAKKK